MKLSEVESVAKYDAESGYLELFGIRDYTGKGSPVTRSAKKLPQV